MPIENRIPESEFRDRTKKVQELMAKEKLDVLIEYAQSMLIQFWMICGGNVEYLSGVAGLMPGVVIIPNKGEPILCVDAGLEDSNITWVKATSWIKDVRGGGGAENVKKAVQDLGLLGGRIGLSGVELMLQPVYESFVSEFPNIEILPRRQKGRIAGIVEQVRAIKSPTEIELIKEANILSDLGIVTFFNAIRPGRRISETVALAEYELMRKGVLTTNIAILGGVAPFFMGMGHDYQALKEWKEGTMVAAECNVRTHDGYWGQICRTFSVGDKPTDTQKRLYEAVYDAQDRITKSIKPGITGEELTQLGINALKEAGYRWDGIRNFHGMGLGMREGLDGVLGEKTPIEEGNYIMVHTHCAIKETGDGALIGDPQLVTKKGSVRLTTLNPQSPKLLPLTYI